MGTGIKNILTVLWIGGIWIIGVLVAPVLFHSMNNGSAASITGKLFYLMGWIGIVAGIYLMIWWIWVDGLKAFRDGRFWLIVLMLTCTLVNQFAIFPMLAQVKPTMSSATEGMFGGGLSNPHTISSLIYLLQAVLGIAYIWSGDGK